MSLVVGIVAVVVVLASYVTWLAARLDRLNIRVEAARAALDAQLVRRAAAARGLAQLAAGSGGPLPADLVAAVEAAAERALSFGAATTPAQQDREAAENALSRALRRAAEAAAAAGGAGGAPAASPPARALLAELEQAAVRVELARQFDADAVRDSRALGSHPVVRLLRLAGHATRPDFFDIDDSVLVPGRHPTGPEAPPAVG